MALPSHAATPAPIDPLPPVIDWQPDEVVASRSVPAQWLTPVERSSFVDSPSQAETLAFLRRMADQSPWLQVETFGRSSQGRELVYVRASKSTGAAGAHSDRPVVMVQGGIHAGEIDGKDAGMMLLRDIAFGGRDALIDDVDLVFVPVLNVDAHAAASPLGRPSQRGPSHKGARTSAQGLDLNRDYTRLASPEVSAVVALLQRFDPALYIDVHVSDGPDYQYDVTWAFAGWGTHARSRRTAEWLMTRWSDDARAALQARGHQPGIYPSWMDENVPTRGLRISHESPRYSTGYGDFIGVPTVLVENHRFKPYRQRVLGTYALIEQSLRSVARDDKRIAQAKAEDRAARPATIAVRWERDPVPLETVAFKGYRYEHYLSPASGARELRWTGEPTELSLPLHGTRVTAAAAIPEAWWIPAGNPEMVAALGAHGIRTDTLAAPRTLELETVQMANGQQRDGFVRSQRRITLALGSTRVLADQPLRLLAAALLEPQSQDSLLASGRFDAALPEESPLPRHLLAPMADAMMRSRPALRAVFEQRLADDAAFAADPQARLRWWEQQSEYMQRARWTYPVYAERG